MSKRPNQQKNANPAVVAADIEIDTVAADVATVVEATIGDTSDAAIDAALAAIEAASMPLPPVSLDEVETVLIDLSDASVTDVDAPEEPVVQETSDEPTEDLEEPEVLDTDIDATLAALAADEEQQAPAPKPAAKKAASTPKATTPAVPKRDFHSVAAIDAAALKANLDGCNAKKVQEKAQNLIQAVETGKKLSKYTAAAVKDFVAKGATSGKDLTGTFQASGLSIGTARAQAQQMTALFKLTGLAAIDTSDGKTLVINDRALADELMLLAA